MKLILVTIIAILLLILADLPNRLEADFQNGYNRGIGDQKGFCQGAHGSIIEEWYAKHDPRMTDDIAWTIFLKKQDSIRNSRK